MSRSILEFALGEAGLCSGVGEVVEGVSVDFGDASAQEGADEELEALEFGLDDYEAEVGLGVCVPRLLFHELDLVDKLGIWKCDRCLGEGDIPAYGFSLKHVPSRHPAMAVFPAHSAL